MELETTKFKKENIKNIENIEEEREENKSKSCLHWSVELKMPELPRIFSPSQKWVFTDLGWLKAEKWEKFRAGNVPTAFNSFHT